MLLIFCFFFLFLFLFVYLIINFKGLGGLVVYASDSHGDGTGSILAAAFGYTSNHRSRRGIKLLDSSLVSSSASYDLINFDLLPGIVCPEGDFGL